MERTNEEQLNVMQGLQDFHFGKVSMTVSGSEITIDEAKSYYDKYVEKYGERLQSIEVEIDGDYANTKCHVSDQSFERIRRITGYLVGTLDRFNNAKRAEERSRVKHSTERDI